MSLASLLAATAIILAVWVGVAQLLAWRDDRRIECGRSGGVWVRSVVGRCDGRGRAQATSPMSGTMSAGIAPCLARMTAGS
jgi:hypothetical protein